MNSTGTQASGHQVERPGEPREVSLQAAVEAAAARYRALFENSHDAILLTRPTDGAVLAANPAACDLFGFSAAQARSAKRDDLLDPTDPRFAQAWTERAGAGAAAAELTFVRMDGGRFEARVSSKLFTDENKEQVACTVIHDITKRKQAEEGLKRSEAKFRATFEYAPLGIAEVSVDGKIIDANAKLVDMLGYARDEIIHLSIAQLTHPDDIENSLNREGTGDSYVVEKRYIRKDRSLLWVNERGSLAPGNGALQSMVLTVEDISARKQAEQDLMLAMESSVHRATHDMLTGLTNRAAFHERLEDALAHAKREGHLVALHLLDLDRFKLINDTLGHHTGDLLLQEVARRIKSHVRATDLVARIGGDEFVVVQTGLQEASAAGVLAGKLVAELGRNYFLAGQNVYSGTSIGIATYPDDASESGELMKLADLALYEAKDRGRFNFRFYRKKLGIALQKTRQFEQELLRALGENEFFLRYQPQFDLSSRKITGIEALLRWRHPSRGTLTAAAFIQDAERARLMPAIGEWTLRTACRKYKEWVNSGLSIPLTVNLSPQQLRDPRLLTTLKDILRETGLPAALLQLEMRESVLCNSTLPADLLKQLKANELRLSIDGVGAEITTLPTLERFPLDTLKPDQRFVRDLLSRGATAPILAAIIGVAHDLDITVCADGVETVDQLAALKQQACDCAQGNLLSTPLDADEMERMVHHSLAT